MPLKDPIACAWCQAPIPPVYRTGYGGLRPRRFCSQRCGTLAWRAQHPAYMPAYQRAVTLGIRRPSLKRRIRGPEAAWA